MNSFPAGVIAGVLSVFLGIGLSPVLAKQDAMITHQNQLIADCEANLPRTMHCKLTADIVEAE